MSRRIAAIAAIILCFVLLLSELCANPVISGAEDVPEELQDAIQNQATGLYSTRLPLVPVWVSVEGMEAGRVFYSIHYFPFGTGGMAYHPDDGYNMEKTLTRLQ